MELRRSLVGEDPGPGAAMPAERPQGERYKVVCVRMRTAEFDQFVSDIGPAGLTANMALRIAARRIAGFLEIDPTLRRTLESLLGSVGALSKMIDDVHAASGGRGSAALEKVEEQRLEFGVAFSKIDALLRTILNVSVRRTDGQRLLAQAALADMKCGSYADPR